MWEKPRRFSQQALCGLLRDMRYRMRLAHLERWMSGNQRTEEAICGIIRLPVYHIGG